MTPADIILIAQEAGVEVGFNDWRATNDALVKFAALVAAAEREACARVCEANENMIVKRHPARVEIDPDSMMARKCAAAIRARGEKP